MIDAIRKFFDDHFDRKSEERGSERSLRLATAALLFEVASADYALDPAEQGLIKRLVEQRFALGEEETSELLSLAEEASREAPGLHGFTVLINEHWSMAERTRLVEQMWEVVYADGRLDDHEQHLMRKVQRLLHVPYRDYIVAKLRQKPAE
jgi:uncharacterized tellurite resistance protein B-like protein